MDLFYGRLNPFSRAAAVGGKAEEMNRKIAEQYDALHCTLEPAQKEMLVHLMELNGEANTTERLDSFVVGFRLGVACICDSLLVDDKPLLHKEFGNLCPTKTNYDVSKRHKNTTGGSPPICGSPSVVNTSPTY